MIREYEFTVIMRADLPEAEKLKQFSKYEELLLKDGGQIIKKDDWGVKKLAYPIKKQFRGHYVNYDFLGHSDHLAETERLMRIDEAVLRYLSIKVGDEVDPESRKVELAQRSELIKKMTSRENAFAAQ